MSLVMFIDVKALKAEFDGMFIKFVEIVCASEWLSTLSSNNKIVVIYLLK